MLQHVGDNAQEFQTSYGNVSAASIGAIQRGLLALEQQGAEKFIGEPMLNIDDLIQTDASGHGRRQRACGRQAAGVAEALLDAAAVAAVGTLRAAARGRRSRQAEARVLLRRSAPAVHRRAEVAARQDRAGRAAHPLQGRRRVLRHPESAGRPGHRARPARQPGPARAARVHAARPEGGARPPPRRCARIPSSIRRQAITELGVGEALVSLLDEKGRPGDRRTRVHPAAGEPHRPHHRRRAGGGDRGVARGGCLREDGRSRVGVRAAAKDVPQQAAPAAPAGSTPSAPRRAAAGWTRSRGRSMA